MQIKYGTDVKNIDVTNICFNKLFQNNIITIPAGELNRSYYFTDPIYGISKKIIIIINDDIIEYDYNQTIIININNQTITTQNIINILNNNPNITIQNINYIDAKTEEIQSKLKLNYGSFMEELPEQKMVVRYLTGSEKVLEIGSNIGRNSLIIASIIDNNNFLSLESNTTIFNQLNENKNLNNFTFYTENSALSNKKLIQNGWVTIPSDNLLPGYKWVNTITLSELYSKYNIQFDTLVLDCDGVFYYILMNMPEILNNIKLIIMENDYLNASEKNYIDNVLKNNNFYVDYVESGGWGPCYNNFYEVWKK